MRGSPLPFALLVLMGAFHPALAQEAVETPALVNPNPLSSMSLDSLSATRSLPLFTPSRTAPVVEAPVEEVAAPLPPEPVADPEQPPPSVELIGIVLTDAAQTALLRDPASNEVHRLTSGDELQGWALKIVDARSVELRSGDRVQDLKMFQTFASPSGEPLGEPYAEGMPSPDVSAPQQPDPEQLPPDMPEPQDIAPDPDSPPPDAPPAVDFDPKPGDTPIPDEGALPPEDESNVNQ